MPFREIAETIGRHLDVPVKSLTAEEALGHFGGAFAAFAAFDVPASSARTRERFGWRPAEPGLIADLDQGHYFTVRDDRARYAGMATPPFGMAGSGSGADRGRRTPATG